MYAIVDIETTGGHASSHGITEIAILVHDGNRLVQSFHSLVNPGKEIPLYITALTGIDSKMLRDAPYFEDIAAEVADMLDRKVFVAHNVNFDYSFIRQHLKHAGFSFEEKKLCTVRLSRKVFPGLPSYSLGNLCRELGISIEQRHRAGGDAKATLKLFEQLLRNGAGVHIDQMLKRNSSEQWLPLYLDKSVIEQLPDAPGVYYFHDRKGKVIYVGKAVNISKRVRSHFTHNDPDRKRQHLLRQVADIRFRVCANELEALVLESTEIRKLWPRFNVSQKQPVRRFGLYQYEDNRGYRRLAIDTYKKNVPALYRFNLLHEGLLLMNRLIEQYDLHPKLCHIDKRPMDEQDLSFLEEPARYNKKVGDALLSLESDLPTMAIIDEGRNAGEQLCLLIERGSFYGMGYIPADFHVSDPQSIRELLEPMPDNDFIRNSIYAYATEHPGKVRRF